MMAETALWERQPEDTPKSWAAFCIYRDLGEERSILKAHQIDVSKKYPDRTFPKEASKRWRDWSSNFSWVRRAAAYDSHLDDLSRAKYEKEKLQARAERHQLIRLAKSKLPSALEALTGKDPVTGKVTNKLKPNEIINLMRLVLQEERAEFDDEPTQRHEHSGPEGGVIQVDVIDEALRKVYGARNQNQEDE